MNAVAMPWLPPPREGEVAGAIAFVIGQWLADWMRSPPRLVVEDVAAPAGGQSGWQVRADRPDLLALGNAACAGQGDADNPLDEHVLCGVGSAMIDDLLGRVESAGTAPECFDVIDHNGQWRIQLALDAAAIVQARRAAAGFSRQLEPVPLATALASEDVVLGCHLGAAHLTMAEVAALSLGDVIVLDRDLHAPVPLTVAGVMPQAGAARIGSDAGQLRVTVTERPNLLRKN